MLLLSLPHPDKNVTRVTQDGAAFTGISRWGGMTFRSTWTTDQRSELSLETVFAHIYRFLCELPRYYRQMGCDRATGRNIRLSVSSAPLTNADSLDPSCLGDRDFDIIIFFSTICDWL